MKKQITKLCTALAIVASAATVSGSAYADGNGKYDSKGWQGFYAGGTIGGAFSNFGKIQDGFDDVTEYSDSYGGLEKEDNSNSITGGVHIGYNIQKGKVVFGVEGEIGLLNAELSTSEKYAFTGGKNTESYSEEISVNLEYLASLRGRIGIAGDKSLVYATAGVAFTEFNASSKEEESFNNQVAFSDSKDISESMTGLVLGGGLEYKLWQNTSLRGEVLHYMFDLKNDGLAETDIDVTTAKVGVSYHF